jgi:glycosyltransferase involved in cell wall biosynthesis
VHQGGGVGGAPVSLLSLLAALDRQKFVAEAVFTEPGAALDRAASLGVPARVLPTGGAFYYSAHARPDPRMLARFLRTFPTAVQQAQAWLRVHRPDVLHLNTSVLIGWAAAARREQVPVVWMVREVLGPNPTLRAWQVRTILATARRVVTISTAVAACFPPTHRLRIVPNAVDLLTFSLDRLSARDAVRAELGLAQDEQALVVLGSVQHAKGHWLLLDALAQVVGRRSRTRLVLVTGGVDAGYAASGRGRVKRALHLPLDNLDALLRDARRRGLGNRLLVTGVQHDVARVLSAADVVVFPSLEPEGFGRPLIEGMAMRRAVLATDVGPSASILGDAGVLVPPIADSMSDALVALLDAPDWRERLGSIGRRRVEREFTLDSQVAAMESIYRQAVCG